MKMLKTKEEILEYLNKGDILLSMVNSSKNFFYRVSDTKICYEGENIKSSISEEDFFKLFNDSVFFLYEKESKAEFVDPKKDEEYYSWKNK